MYQLVSHFLKREAMIRHNLFIAYRNSLRYKSSFFINLIGLSTGLACVILIFIWVNDELRMDQFHAHGDRLYQVLENVDQGTGMITRESTPAQQRSVSRRNAGS